MSWFYSKPGEPFDQDAQDYFDRIVAGGSTIDVTARSGVTLFCIGCKSDNIWADLLDVGLFCGSNLAAGLMKLKKLSSGWSYTLSGSGESYSQSVGFPGNVAGSLYLASGVLADALSSGDSGIAVYNRSSADSTNPCSHGCLSDGTHTFTVHAPYSNNQPYSDQYASANQVTGSAITGAVRFIHARRASGPVNSIDRDGVSVASSGTVGGTIPSAEITFMARNNAFLGVKDLYTPHTISFAALTTGMDSTKSLALFNRVQTLQTSLGRQV